MQRAELQMTSVGWLRISLVLVALKVLAASAFTMNLCTAPLATLLPPKRE
jgi:hypothetical protein